MVKRTQEELDRLIQDTIDENFDGFSRRDGSSWWARNGSTDVRIFLRDSDRITVAGPVAYEVPLSGELCWFILEKNGGQMVPLELLTSEDDPSRVTVIYSLTRTTEGLDSDEIRDLISVVAIDANNDDESIVDRFGGKLNFSE